MGLEQTHGVHADDVKLALKGRVREGYEVQLLQTAGVFVHSVILNGHWNTFTFVFQFNPASKLSENNRFYNGAPTDNDKVHVLVCVIPADTVGLMSTEVLQKIRDIRMEASSLGESNGFFMGHISPVVL